MEIEKNKKKQSRDRMENVNKMNISFVMPTYNSADTVVESVESIMEGNFKDGDELIIVDGKSSDNTIQVLENLRGKYPVIKLILPENHLGCPSARNVGIETSSNPLIFNLDSDNVLEPGSINKLKQFLIKEKADVATFGEIHYFKTNISDISHKWICAPGVLTLTDLLGSSINPAFSGNYLYTKDSWERIGNYWEYGDGLHEAWGFSLKQIANGSKFIVMPNTFYYHRYGYSSLYIRESKDQHTGSLIATKMIKPFIDLLVDEDADYIMSEKGSRKWFKNLDDKPINIKSGGIPKRGRIVYCDSQLIPEKKLKMFSLKIRLKKKIFRLLPSSLKNKI